MVSVVYPLPPSPVYYCGMCVQIPSGLPRNLEAAVHRYGSASYKAACLTVLDPAAKLNTTLLYGNPPLLYGDQPVPLLYDVNDTGHLVSECHSV